MKNKSNDRCIRRGFKKGGAGFTLIELLIVIAIIGVLSALVLANFSTSRRKARDTQRMSDLAQLQTAIEQYYDDYAVYPDCVNGPTHYNFCANYTGGPVYLLSSLVAAPTYIPIIPTDPSNANGQYGYYYARTYRKTGTCTVQSTGLNSDFILLTKLEGPTPPCPSGVSGITFNNTSVNIVIGN